MSESSRRSVDEILDGADALELAEELDASVRDEYRRLWYAVSESKSNSPE